MATDWIAQHWRAKEFDCPCCKVGGAEMDQTLLSVLDECRKQLGVALTCNSGYRCPVHNSHPSIGSTSSSYHLKKMAADITFARRGLRTRVNILRIFVTLENIGRKHGGLGLGIYPSFIHCDVRTLDSKVGPARWSSFHWPRL